MPIAKEQTSKVIRLYFIATCLFLYVAALLAPDTDRMLSGLITIWTSPSQLTTDFFAVGGIAAGVLNVAVTMSVWTVILCLPGVPVKNTTLVAWLLTMGFSFWGSTVLNMLPFLLGTYMYSRFKNQHCLKFVDSAMFSTTLCPLIIELMIRYPNKETTGFSFLGVTLAIIFGIFVSVLMPPLSAHSPNVHKGFNLYSHGLSAGILGLFLNAWLYKNLDFTTPTITATLHEGNPLYVRTFCIVYFVLCLIAGFLLSGKSFASYKELLKDTGHKPNFIANYGIGTVILNIGVYGLFLTLYYIATEPPATGVTLGIAFCMVCLAANGTHPLNVWPIMMGYVAASLVSATPVSDQAIAVGLCFASGLAPIVGIYGWWAGALGGMAHYALFTSVSAIHGGFCLYNGGFTSAIIAMMVIPLLETFTITKAQRVENTIRLLRERNERRQQEQR